MQDKFIAQVSMESIDVITTALYAGPQSTALFTSSFTHISGDVSLPHSFQFVTH